MSLDADHQRNGRRDPQRARRCQSKPWTALALDSRAGLDERSTTPSQPPAQPPTPSPPSPPSERLLSSPRGGMSPRGGHAKQALGLRDLMSSGSGSSTSSSFRAASNSKLRFGTSSTSRTSSGGSSSRRQAGEGGRLQRPVKGSDSELLRMAVGNRQRAHDSLSPATSPSLARAGDSTAAALRSPSGATAAMSEVLALLADLPLPGEGGKQPREGKERTLALPLSDADGGRDAQGREASAKYPSASSSPQPAARGRRRVSLRKDSLGVLGPDQGSTVQERMRRRQRPQHHAPALDFDCAIESFYDDLLPKASPIQHLMSSTQGGFSGAASSQGVASPGAKGRSTLRGLRLQEFVLGAPYEDVHRHYVLEEKKLGEGQYGTVTRCTDRVTGEAYACKTISKRRIRKPEDVADVQREVACLNVLKGHPGFVSVKRVFEDSESVHIVMELCEGGDLLDHILAHGPLPEAHAARLCRFLMESLSLCHSQGIIHRDVKPENIMLAQPGSASLAQPGAGPPFKLADFGLAVFSRDGEVRQDATGTPEYMAPETFLKAYDARADVWSAGVVLYVALSNMPPFWASTKQSLKESILHKDVQFPAHRWGAASRECMDLVLGMLDKNPETRLSASEVLSHPWIQAHSETF